MPAAQFRPALLIADLHLSAVRPDALARFLRFMSDAATLSSALYILGDLFEYWPGDDVLSHTGTDSVVEKTVAALGSYAHSGRALHVLHGNRDFLLGEKFLAATGAVLMEDSTIVRLGGVPTLLLHGDALCTGDIAYQTFKAEVRSAAWKSSFLARPLGERHAIMAAYRAESEGLKSTAAPRIMDVDDAAVDAQFVRFAVRRMIHGHTHRHARHIIEVNGERCERWGLPDWYETGGYLAIGRHAPQLRML